MKRFIKSAAIVAATALFAVSFSSCNKDPQDTTEEVNKAQKEAIVKQYLLFSAMGHPIFSICGGK